MTHKERFIHAEIEIEAPIEDVWEVWTTEEGIKTFLAPSCDVEFQPDGKFEIFFDPEAEPGERGGEGNRIMAIQSMEMFSFTWNAPPSLPDVRAQRTHVVVRFYWNDGKTTVSLYHDGWGSGGEWEEAYQYFL